MGGGGKRGWLHQCEEVVASISLSLPASNVHLIGLIDYRVDPLATLLCRPGHLLGYRLDRGNKLGGTSHWV